MSQTSVYDTLARLGIELPAVNAPAAAYVMAAQTGNTVFLSGHIARKDGKVWTGKLGKDIDTESGKAAARAIAIDLLATLHAHVGDLNRVTRIVKVMSLVNSTPNSPSSTWSPTVPPSCWPKCSATRASMPAALSAWRRSRWAPASRSR